MTVARINHISDFEDQIIQINGWVYNSRRSGKIGFLMLRDGFGLIHVEQGEADAHTAACFAGFAVQHVAGV